MAGCVAVFQTGCQWSECISQMIMTVCHQEELRYDKWQPWLTYAVTLGLLHEVQGPLANGSAQKYYCCVDRADNTCAVSILAVIKG